MITLPNTNIVNKALSLKLKGVFGVGGLAFRHFLRQSLPSADRKPFKKRLDPKLNCLVCGDLKFDCGL